MERQSHYLKPTKGNAIPGQFAALYVESSEEDCNTVADVREQQFKSATLITWKWKEGKHVARQLRTFHDAGEFWSALYRFARPGSATWIYSYDTYRCVTLLGIWNRILNRELVLAEKTDNADDSEPGKNAWHGFVVMSDPPNILICRPIGGFGTLRFLDPRNYGVSDWHSLCRCSGISKHGGDNGGIVSSEFPSAARSQASITEAFVRNLVAFVQEMKLGSLQSTAGSQAITGWRRSYLTHSIHVHDNEEVLQLEREAYYGGRCECRFLGRVCSSPELYHNWTGQATLASGLMVDGPIYHYDINSAFPAAAAELSLPVRLAVFSCEPTPSILSVADNGLSCVADCTVETDEPAYPLRRDGEEDVVWPVGRFRTVLPDAEFRHARERRRILHVHRFAAYESEPVLRHFVQSLYAARMRAREQGNVGFEEICKRILVAVVGKFVQVQRTWITVPGFKCQYRFAQFFGRHPINGKVTQWRTLADETAYLEESGEHPESMPIVAAAITSFVRMYLWRIIGIIGKSNVYYYDTDSVWTNREGSARILASGLVNDNALGSLKIAGQYSSVDFYGIKHYQAENVLKCSGLSHSARINGVVGNHADDAISFGSFLWSKEVPSARTVRREIKTNRDYRHGVVNRDGTISPFRVGFIEKANDDNRIVQVGGSCQAVPNT